MIRSVATYEREPSIVPADMNTVVACPVIPAVKVLAKVSTVSQSASSPVTCRGSKPSTANRAISVIMSSCAGRALGIPTIPGHVDRGAGHSCRG